MCPVYDDNAEYLNDVLVFVDLMQSKVLGRHYPSDAKEREIERAALAAMYTDIRVAGRTALRSGIKLGLEKVIRKNKLDDIEALILCVLVFAAVQGDENLNKVISIRKMVQFLSMRDSVATVPYWGYDSRLVAKKLCTTNHRGVLRPVVTASDLFIEAATLDQVLGTKRPKGEAPMTSYTPAALCEKLGEYVVGQEHARRVLATGVFKHLQICRLNKRRKGLDRLQKANILLIGQTGTGKTHLCRTLAQVLKVPFVISDATQFTETGYVGANVEEMLVALRAQGGAKPGGSLGGIIFIDEIDKIAQKNVGPSHNSNRDVSGLSVQQELLKLLDGETVRYQNNDFDVSNILFIAGGAFAGLEEVISTRLKHRHIGFVDDLGAAERKEPTGLKAASAEDIMAYGFMPEFVGRFASLVALEGLGKSELVDIMTKPRNSLLSQYQALFKASGIDLQIPQAALEWVADQAIRNNTGARGLKSILETHLSPILFEQVRAACGQKGHVPLKEIAFDPEAVEQPAGIRLA